MAPDKSSQTGLFELGQKYFNAFKEEFAGYGLEASPRLGLKKGEGLLCYYNLDDEQIYLSVPDLNSPLGKLQAVFLQSLLGCESKEELLRFFELFIPHVIAHEMAHHYRHRRGLFDKTNLWREEQIANKLSVAVVKHRLSPPEKTAAKKFLQQAINALAAQLEAKNIAVDSYISPLDALNVTGAINVADFENIELIQQSLGLSEEDMLKDSGRLSAEMVDRLEQRADLIKDINVHYTADQIKYIYYHVSWLYLDLSSRETEYVDEFARNYLNLRPNLLPTLRPTPNPSPQAIQACFKASQDAQPHSPVAARYFYKRYRALLLAKLQAGLDQASVQAERLKREATLLLESWSEQESDTLNYLAQMAPASLRPLFPHLIAAHPNNRITLPADLPAETDRRLWQYTIHHTPDEAAANTLYRLGVLDQTDIYRPLPAALMLELAHRFWLVKFAPGEPVIWENERNDDVFFLVDGLLDVFAGQDGQETRVGQIRPGEMFGEIAFFTEDPRYATVRAAAPSRCFVLTDVDLQLLAYKHPVILMQMAGVLAKRLADMYRLSRNETV